MEKILDRKRSGWAVRVLVTGAGDRTACGLIFFNTLRSLGEEWVPDWEIEGGEGEECHRYRFTLYQSLSDTGIS